MWLIWTDVAKGVAERSRYRKGNGADLRSIPGGVGHCGTSWG